MALTGKRARFVQEFLVDLNGTQAAIRAGYAPRRAAEQAYELLRHPDIDAAIAAAKIERSEAVKVDAAWVLKRLVAEAEADINDLYNVAGDLKPISEWPLIWRQGLVQGIDIDFAGNVKKVRLSDRTRRLELIGKHVNIKAFSDVVEHKGLEGLADRLARAKSRTDTEGKPRAACADRTGGGDDGDASAAEADARDRDRRERLGLPDRQDAPGLAERLQRAKGRA